MVITTSNSWEDQVFRFSKTQARAVMCASGIMKTQIKLLAHKIWHSMILEYSLRDKYTNEFVSAMDIISNSSTQEIIWKNRYQMMSLEKLVLKKNVYKINYKYKYLFNFGFYIHLWLWLDEQWYF